MQSKHIVHTFIFLFITAALVACGSGGSGGSAPKLEPPSDLRVVPDAGFIKLSWNDNSNNETGFFIYREEAGGETTLQALSKIGEVDADVESFQDDDVEEAKTYRYAVAAVNATGPTPPVSQSGPAVSPDPPISNNEPFISFFGARLDDDNPLKVILSWTISDSDADILSCDIDIRDDGNVDYSVDDCVSGDGPAHTFATAGTYTISLEVSDGKATTKETLEVTVPVSLR